MRKSYCKFEEIWLEIWEIWSAIKRFMLAVRLRPPTNLIAHRKAAQIGQPLNLQTLHHNCQYQFKYKFTTNIKTNSPQISIQIHHKYQYQFTTNINTNSPQIKNITRSTTNPRYWIYYLSCLKFGHQVEPLASVLNLSIMWHHLNWSQIWPQDGATVDNFVCKYWSPFCCIGCVCEAHNVL